MTISGGDGTSTIDISEDGTNTKTTSPMLINSKTYTVEVKTYSNGMITAIEVK